MRKLLLIAAASVMMTLGMSATKAQAQSDPFIGQITFFGGNFAPRGWAFCDGQLLAIAQYSALFSILGTTYGGDGRTTFALPDMRSRVLVHEGTGPGLSSYPLGSKGGVENVTLNVNQIPSHNHGVAMHVSTGGSDTTSPSGAMIASSASNAYATPGGRTSLDAQPATGTISQANAGGSQPHTNISPYLTTNCIIALEGLFPSRS